jgi:hypothetical protein
MTCVEVPQSALTPPILTSDFEVKGYAQGVKLIQVELHTFEVLSTYLSDLDLQSKVTAFACHSICTTCFGPAPNACDEFTALIGLDEVTINSSDSLVIPATDVRFQGRSYPSVQDFAVTLWVYFTTTYSGSV